MRSLITSENNQRLEADALKADASSDTPWGNVPVALYEFDDMDITATKEWREIQVDSVLRTARMAEIRCSSFGQLLRRLDYIWNDPDADALILHLRSLPMSARQADAVKEKVEHLLAVADQLPGDERARIDRIVWRIVYSLPAKRLGSLIRICLPHRTKSRRLIAYRLLKRMTLSNEDGCMLLQLYDRFGDRELLHVLARSAASIPPRKLATVLENLEEPYWRMRILAECMAQHARLTSKLMGRYLMESIWAAGRSGARRYFFRARKLMRTTPLDADLLSLYAWACGKLRYRRGLADLDELIREFVECRRPTKEETVHGTNPRSPVKRAPRRTK